MQPLIKQIESFSGILIVYFNCKNILFYNILVSYQDASSRFHLLGENPCGGEILMSESRVRWRNGKLRRLNGRSHISSSSWYFGWPFTGGSTTWSCSTKSFVVSRMCLPRNSLIFRVYRGVRTCEVFGPFDFLGFSVLTSLRPLLYVTREFHRFFHRGWADPIFLDTLEREATGSGKTLTFDVTSTSSYMVIDANTLIDLKVSVDSFEFYL